MKIIKSEIKSSGDILAYLEEEKILKNTILDVFRDATGEVQCRIACLHLNQSIKWAGEIVMEGLANKADSHKSRAHSMTTHLRDDTFA